MMKAIKTVADQRAELQEVPIPTLRDGYVLVKVKTVALNPTDWKHIDFVAPPGTTIVCDFAGVVEAVGSKVTKPWRKGDRIAGFTHGGNAAQLEDGCGAEYCVAKAEVALKIPDNLTDEEACTLGVGITTVGQGMYQSLELPLPDSGTAAGRPLLIYGGSTATGTLAIQYARLSGCSEVLTTCSPHNFDLVKSLGVDAVFDYNDPECTRLIREHTGGKLALAFDCIASEESANICADAMGPDGGVVSYLRPVRHKREDVEAKETLGYTAFGESFEKRSKQFEAKPEDLAFAEKFWQLSAGLLAEGKVKVHPPQVNSGGLQGVFDGLQSMRDGKVSGKKLVYRVEETT